MTQPVLEPDSLQHPCEGAFDILLSARIDAHVLYLDVSSCGPHPTDMWVVSWRYRHDTNTRSDHVAKNSASMGEQRLDPSIELPVLDHTVDLLVLRVFSLRKLNDTNLTILMNILTRHLRDDGELFIICSAPPQPYRGLANHRGGQKLATIYRLSRVAKDIVTALPAGERKLMAEALRDQGFQHTESFAAESNASGEPTRLSLLKRQLEMRQRISLKQWLRLRSRCDLTLIRASRHKLPPSRLSSALQSMRTRTLGNATTKQGPTIIDSMLISPKGKVVILGRLNCKRFVIRIPFTPEAHAACEQNMLALRTLQINPDLARIAPRPLLEIDIGGYYFSGESLVPGTPLTFLPLDEAALRLVEDLLYQLNPHNRLRPARLEGEAYNELIKVPLAGLASIPAVSMYHEALSDFFSDSLLGSTVNLGLCHGDFSVRNIYMDRGRISGVIDWDDGIANGIPVLDAIGHLISRQSRRGNGIVEAISSLAAKHWPVDYELDFLERCYIHFDISRDQHFALVMLYWLRVVSNQSKHWFAGNDEFAVRNIEPIVNLIVEKIEATGRVLVTEAVSPCSQVTRPA